MDVSLLRHFHEGNMRGVCSGSYNCLLFSRVSEVKDSEHPKCLNHLMWISDDDLSRFPSATANKARSLAGVFVLAFTSLLMALP